MGYLAKIVDGSKDFVALRAREPFDFCTSLSCLESIGAMHTFLVAYREHPSRLDVVAPGTEGRLVFTFDKIALVKGQVFRGYFYEKGGARNLVMTMNIDDINKARRL